MALEPALARSTVHSRLCDIFYRVVGEQVELCADTPFSALPGWDSVMLIVLIYSVEQEFEINISGSQIGRFSNFGGLKAFLENR